MLQGTLIVLLQRIIKQEDGVYLLLKDPNLDRLYLYLVLHLLRWADLRLNKSIFSFQTDNDIPAEEVANVGEDDDE
jgi:hypothetical protein